LDQALNNGTVEIGKSSPSGLQDRGGEVDSRPSVAGAELGWWWNGLRADDEKNTTGDFVARVFVAVTRGRKSVSTTNPQPAPSTERADSEVA
jgi:hypothetical protein